VLSKIKFKVLFSSEHIRSNLYDYIIRIYKNIRNANHDSGQTVKHTVVKAYIKISKSKKVLELSVQKDMVSAHGLVLLKEVSSYQQLSKMKTKEKYTNVLINSTAHNLFTPINGILGLTQLLEQEVENNPVASRYVQIMT
jgi:nitrogen-specific signal transduction histidine kinase